MTLGEIVKILEAEVAAEQEDMDISVSNACSSDMMSAVLYYHTPDSLLITGLIQPHVIRTAEIAGIRAIVFILNKKPDKTTVNLAREKGIPLIFTKFCMYTASGRLFAAGLPGCLYN